VIVGRGLGSDAVEGLVGLFLGKEGPLGEFEAESWRETPEGGEVGGLDRVLAEEGGEMRHAAADDADVHLDDAATR
jgi:hypothetical protein